MNNHLIGWCQCRLKYHKGYDLGKSGCNHDGVDDDFGPTTESVVRQFQEDNQDWFFKLYGKKLDKDGIIGYDTITILF
jgi:hypothetical protein